MSYGKTNYATAKKKRKTAGRGPGPTVCKFRNFGKPCKLCKKVEQLNMSEEKKDQDIASQCRAKGSYFMTIIDLKNKQAGRQLFGSGIEIWKTLIDLLPDPDDGDSDGVDFTNVRKAYPVLIKRTGKGLQTSYTVQIGREPIKLPSSLIKKRPVNLDKVLDLLENEELERWIPEADKTSKIFIFPPWKEDGEDFYKEVFYHWKAQLLSMGDSGGDGEEGDDEDGWADEGEEEEWDDDENDGDEDPYEDEEEDGEEEDVGVPEFEEMNSVQLRKFAKVKKLKIKNIAAIKGSKLRKAVDKAWRTKFDVPL